MIGLIVLPQHSRAPDWGGACNNSALYTWRLAQHRPRKNKEQS